MIVAALECFNPRAPCGARPPLSFPTQRTVCFNPRAPCGARPTAYLSVPPFVSFNPRAPCGARLPHALREVNELIVSIHAPRVGRDSPLSFIKRFCKLFQSTRPVWGATRGVLRGDVAVDVSIHAPRVGRDHLFLVMCCHNFSFNPRAPCGARLNPYSGTSASLTFQSTRPVWGATLSVCEWFIDSRFQSTRPVWGATFASMMMPLGRMFQSTRPVWGATTAGSADDPVQKFQSTRPVWGATDDGRQGRRVDDVSIHAPRVGRDLRVVVTHGHVVVSIHAPRVGRDLRWRVRAAMRQSFNPRAPCGARQPRSMTPSKR